jgi:formylglycine-generating enzyme required for sulfatase activity
MPDFPIEKRVARSDFWRGDLLRALQHFEHTRREFEAFARDRGYDRRPMAPSSLVEDLLTVSTEEREPAVAAVKTVAVASDGGLTSHWLPTRYLLAPHQGEEDHDTGSRDLDAADDEPVRICDPSAIQLPQNYLASWPELRNRLEPLLGFPANSRRVDTDRLVKKFSRGEVIRRIPYQEHKRTHDRIVLIRDQSRHCVPYRADQSLVANRLQSISVRNGFRILEGAIPFELVESNQSSDERQHLGKRSTRAEWPIEPEPGSHVLILGDLGWLDESGDTFACDSRDAWRQACRRWALKGCQVFALVPFRPERLPLTLSRWVHAMAWQGNAVEEIARSERDSAVKQLLTMAYPAQRIEPGLLRAIRLLCPGLQDASIEATFWQDRRHSGARTDAIKNDRMDIRREFEAAFEALEPKQITEVLRLIRSYRIATGFSILWQTELLNLAPWIRSLIDSDGEDEAMAIRTVGALLHQMEHGGKPGLQDRLASLSLQATDHGLQDPRAGQALRMIRASCLSDAERHQCTRLSELSTDSKSNDMAFRIVCEPARLQLHAPIPRTPNRDWVCTNAVVMLHANRHLIEVHGITDRERAFWQTGRKPDWASDYGTDPYGAWCEFQVPRHDGDGVVTQRMRWIPPGEFMMGSPESEEGRWDDEGPQHPVKLTQGYWLADTPVTQELWMAISDGETPSAFKGESLPVESVSWDDCQAWLGKLRKQHASLEASIPTEAQWEYACRASSTMAYWYADDPKESTKYAWFGDNSERRTHPVKQLEPNVWGLYDMHGNVWEWCSDWYGSYPSTHQTDPIGPTKGSQRVIRGGSWGPHARSVRSACRRACRLDFRNGDLGFRLLSFAVGAEPSERATTPEAEPGVERASLDSAEQEYTFLRSFDLDGLSSPALRTEFAELDFGSLRSVRVISDVAGYQFDRITKPAWAVDFGSDEYGLHATFEIEPVARSETKKPRKKRQSAMTDPVRQRLRWIPPGRFVMGSPVGEAGRGKGEVQHNVNITHGYWLFDTPCTQAMWECVMGSNLSHFKDPERPVERVSWEDISEFASRLRERLPKELRFRLPTEAEWEYACRAGSTTATYAGDLEILGDANAPVLDDIAWYGGNSGHEYDLRQSANHTWRKDRQYPGKQGGTRKVARRSPNAWGLFDTLGNVWEWCWDKKGAYEVSEQRDPIGPAQGSGRVIRGGGWDSHARSVRSACRFAFHPDVQLVFLGFRLLSSAFEPDLDEPSRGRLAERRSEGRADIRATSDSEARKLR